LDLARRRDALLDLVRGLRARGPTRPHAALPGDVTDHEAIDQVIRQLQSRQWTPDVVLYCAGVGQFGPVEKTSEQHWHHLFAVNVTGAFRMCAALAPLLPAGASVLLVGSTAGLAPFADGGAYCASKAALHAFAASLRQELRVRQIAVSLILPESMATPFWGDGASHPEYLAPGDVA